MTAAPLGFSARHDAVAREYRYRLVPGPVPPLFLRDVAWWVKGSLDVGAMREAAEALLGEHDFASFCVAETAARANAAEGMGTRRSIELLEVEPGSDLGEHAVVVRVVGRSLPALDGAHRGRESCRGRERTPAAGVGRRGARTRAAETPRARPRRRTA